MGKGLKLLISIIFDILDSFSGLLQLIPFAGALAGTPWDVLCMVVGYVMWGPIGVILPAIDYAFGYLHVIGALIQTLFFALTIAGIFSKERYR